MRNIKKFFLSLSTVAFITATTPALSFTVYDPANHAQNLLTAVRMLTQITQTQRQLQLQLRMVQQLKNGGDLQSLMRTMHIANNTADYLLHQANGLSELSSQFDITFPKEGDLNQAGVQRDQIRNSASRSLETQRATLQNARSIASTLQSVATKSQNAVGQLQAIQAGNQTSLAQAQLLSGILQSMAANAERAAIVTAEEDARHRRAIKWKENTLKGLKASKSSGPKPYEPGEFLIKDPFQKKALP